MVHENPRHQTGCVPSAGYKAAEGAPFGRLGVCMKRLWVKLFGESDYLICPDPDGAKTMYIAFNVILEVPIGDRTQKWHCGPLVSMHGCLVLSLLWVGESQIIRHRLLPHAHGSGRRMFGGTTARQ